MENSWIIKKREMVSSGKEDVLLFIKELVFSDHIMNKVRRMGSGKI